MSSGGERRRKRGAELQGGIVTLFSRAGLPIPAQAEASQGEGSSSRTAAVEPLDESSAACGGAGRRVRVREGARRRTAQGAGGGPWGERESKGAGTRMWRI